MTARAPRRRAAVAGGGSTHGAANGHVPLCCRAEAGGVLAGILSAALLASTGCRARSPRAARAAARRRDHPPRRPPPQAPHPRDTRASRLPETALPPQYAPLGRSGRAAAAAAHGRRPPPQPQRLPHRPALARGRAAAAVAPTRQRPRGAASGQPPCRSGSRRWRKALPSRRARATARPPVTSCPTPARRPRSPAIWSATAVLLVVVMAATLSPPQRPSRSMATGGRAGGGGERRRFPPKRAPSQEVMRTTT